MNKNWIEKYWDYMDAENFEKASQLKYPNLPKSFFKYRILSKQTINSIIENSIWLAEIATLNDPFECAVQFDNDECWRKFYSSEKFINMLKTSFGYEITQQEIKQLTNKSSKPFNEFLKLCEKRNLSFKLTEEEQLNKIHSRWSEIITESSQNLRVCSLSQINSSLLLWSHYCADHKGICIEYDFMSEEKIPILLQPIKYCDKIQKLDTFEDYAGMKVVSSSHVKSTDWKYEKEWRITVYKQSGYFPQKINICNPIAIYLGTRFHLNDKKLIKSLLKIALEKNIPLYQMKKDPNEFKLISETYTAANSQQAPLLNFRFWERLFT